MENFRGNGSDDREVLVKPTKLNLRGRVQSPTVTQTPTAVSCVSHLLDVLFETESSPTSRCVKRTEYIKYLGIDNMAPIRSLYDEMRSREEILEAARFITSGPS